MSSIKRVAGNLYSFVQNTTSLDVESSAELAFKNGVQAQNEAITSGTNDFRKALRFYNRALSYGTSVSSKALLNIGSIKLRLNEFNKALKAFNKARKIHTRYASAYYNIGVCLQHLNRELEAIDNYCVAIQLQPGYLEAHYNLGFIYYSRGEYHFALKHLRSAYCCSNVDTQSKINIENVISKIEESGRVDISGRTLVVVKNNKIELFPGDA